MADEKQSPQINFKKVYNHRVPFLQAQFLYRTAKSNLPYIEWNISDCPYKKLINNLLDDAADLLKELSANNLADYLLAKIHITQNIINGTFKIQGNNSMRILDDLAKNHKGELGTKAAVYLTKFYLNLSQFNKKKVLAYALRAYVGNKKNAHFLIYFSYVKSEYFPLENFPDLKLYLLTQSNKSYHLIEKATYCAIKKIILDKKTIDTLHKEILANCDIQSIFTKPIGFINQLIRKTSTPFFKGADSAQEIKLLATTTVKDIFSATTHQDIYNIPLSHPPVKHFNTCLSILVTGTCKLLSYHGFPTINIKPENLNKFLVKCSLTHPQAGYLAFLYASRSGNDNLAAQLLTTSIHLKTKHFIDRWECIEPALSELDMKQKSQFLDEIEPSLSHSFALNRGINLLLGNLELGVPPNPQKAKIYFDLALELSSIPLIPYTFCPRFLTAKEIVQKIVAAIHSKNPISTDFSVLEQLGPPYSTEYLILENSAALSAPIPRAGK